MAAFEANGLSAFAQRTDPPSRPLPTGPCSLRDANGPCGCQQFWDKTSLELHHGSSRCIPVSERSTSCVCGHHACFHVLPRSDRARSLVPTAHDRLNARQVYGASFPSQPASQSSSRVEVRATQKRVLLLDQSWDQHGFDPFPDRQVVSQAGELSLNSESRDSLSQASTSGLPPIPSICLLSQDRRVTANDGVQGSHTLIAQSGPGLGLGLSLTANTATAHPSSSSAVILEGQTLVITPENAYNEEERLPSTRTNSILSGRSPANSPGLDPMNQIKYFIQDQDLHLTTGGDTICDTYRPDEFLHSATEVATPSIANTPDLRAVDEAAQDALPLLNSLFNSISNQNGHGVDNRSQGSISAPLPQLLLAHSSTLAPDELQRLWRALLQEVRSAVSLEVKSYLRPLYNIIISMPNLNNFQRDIIDRLSVIEANNNSFNLVLPDECRKQHSDNEDRTIALEHRVDELERLLQSIDANQSTTSADRRNFGQGTESFGSNHSTTSSTLVYTGVTREEFESLQNEVRHKAAALPSPKHPWEVEVVLLPWGPELRGLWYHSDQPIYEQEGTTMEEDEDWTQTPSARRRTSRNHQEAPGLSSPDPRRSSRSSMSNGDMEGGWSSQAISDWAEDSADDWLSPRAIGKGNGSKDQVVYERLKSRGFVRHIELRSANARDIHAALSKAFHDLLGHLRYTDEDEDPTIRMYPGLRASFVPLRKDFKNARLRFLTPSEMATSALWDARFLTAGVMMRLSGSRKRLYVTQREAYIQYGGEMRTSWTWPELKLLPRYHPDPDSQMEGSDEQKLPQAPNADVVEECWAFHEDCDALPASVTSSFSSSHSAQIAMRPADQNWRRSMTPSSILKDRKAQPISPLSEHHPQRPGHVRLRTASDSRADSALPSSAKRRLDASPVKPSSAPQVALHTPSASVVRPKRRRVIAPSSPQPDGDGQSRNTDIPQWAHTPRRSNEPPSPFFSSQPELVRVNSDVASRVGKNAPFAYATPHSGPYGAESAGDGGGDTELDSVYSEKSWPGVDEDAAEQMKYSDGTSGFDSEDDIAIDPDEVDDESEGSSQHGSGSEDGDTDVFDHLLDVLGT